MKWLQDLNETEILANGFVRFKVFAEGEGLSVSLDNRNFIEPNINKNGVPGFQFDVNPNDIPLNVNGQRLQNFWVKEWGCLLVPEKIENQELPERENPIAIEPQKPNNIQVVDSNAGFYNIWSKGCVGYKYGSDYWTLLNELDGGESKFEFYGQDVEYPLPYTYDGGFRQCTDDLVAIHLPSHSVTAIWGHKEARAKIEIKMYDEQDNLVFHLFDTKGGLHPVANANGSEIGNSQRGNNHPDNCCRWIKYGVYRIVFTNHSEKTENDNFIINCKVEDTAGVLYRGYFLNCGESFETNINFNKLDSQFQGYKLNCNYSPLPQ
jgi:hypothetical protein